MHEEERAAISMSARCCRWRTKGAFTPQLIQLSLLSVSWMKQFVFEFTSEAFVWIINITFTSGQCEYGTKPLVVNAIWCQCLLNADGTCLLFLYQDKKKEQYRTQTNDAHCIMKDDCMVMLLSNPSEVLRKSHKFSQGLHAGVLWIFRIKWNQL